jgi:hypothetical protein
LYALKVLGELYHIYYNNRDLRLLLDLLATSSGIAPAIAIMTLFDKVKIILIFNFEVFLDALFCHFRDAWILIQEAVVSAKPASN